MNLSPMDIPDWGAFLINAVCGFGIGSFIQGDGLGGAITLTGDVVGIALYIGGLLSLADNINSDTNNVSSIEPGLGLIISGAVVFIGAQIFSMIRPWVYDGGSGFALNLSPSIDENGNPVCVAALKFQY
ncbi:MAG: P13 family porin [Spirochaetaceae bacterium]|nr:P13 family porin [Spirochaetaceae bacterium]